MIRGIRPALLDDLGLAAAIDDLVGQLAPHGVRGTSTVADDLGTLPDPLLSGPAAADLYHRVAAPLPIVDYHSHLSPRDIAEDRRFDDLHAVWLAGDHYKWRALRADGVPEDLITGAASPQDKFRAWAATVPHTLRNPLFHWTHLEPCC